MKRIQTLKLKKLLPPNMFTNSRAESASTLKESLGKSSSVGIYLDANSLKPFGGNLKI